MKGGYLRTYLMSLIYEDYLRAFAAIQEGADPGAAYLAHEGRVAALRERIEAMDAADRPVLRQAS